MFIPRFSNSKTIFLYPFSPKYLTPASSSCPKITISPIVCMFLLFKAFEARTGSFNLSILAKHLRLEPAIVILLRSFLKFSNTYFVLPSKLHSFIILFVISNSSSDNLLFPFTIQKYFFQVIHRY